MVEVIWTDSFRDDVSRIRDNSVKEKIRKHVEKILGDSQIGKPLRYGMKGERTIRIAAYRLIYKKEGAVLILLRFEHRRGVYG
ncbi:MAG: type II toxin-antitoxin system RelE/ParE family toxin [Candidatus Micrarchaeota archaeon]|nr:type II toxin-antitoxin system RelE/ParE family toxin [Candidatus Micrarchaeota archaeon]